MFQDVPECSGMFRDVPCSGFYRRPKLQLQYSEIPARSTCHVPRERAVLDLIALRKHDKAIFSELWKKNPFLTYML